MSQPAAANSSNNDNSNNTTNTTNTTNNNSNSNNSNSNNSNNSSSNNPIPYVHPVWYKHRGATTRLRELFFREGVPWVSPINEQDMLIQGHVAHNIDDYLRSEYYDRDYVSGHELLFIGDIMKQTGANNRIAQADWAVCRNAIAFDEHAWNLRNADEERRARLDAEDAAEERRRQDVLDEAALREANARATYVERALARIDRDDYRVRADKDQ